MRDTRGKRSPIQETRLRQGGEGLRTALAQEFERAYFGIGYGGATLVAGALFLVFHSLGLLARPVLSGVVVVVIGATIAWWSARRLFKQGRPLKLSLDGEEHVADSFRQLQAKGYRVFHDMPSRIRPGSNIDHVVVGEAGVFVIETKTRSKAPTDRVRYDGTAVYLAGGPPDTSPIDQARAAAKEIEQLLRSAGRQIMARPVVLFPGWYIDVGGGTHWKHTVCVTNNKYFINGLLNGKLPQSLSQDEIAFISATLDAVARGAMTRML